MLGHHRPASETPCGVSLAGRWWPAYCGIWILSSPLINLKKSCQSWTPPLDPRMNADKKSLETVFSTAIVWRQIAT